MKATPTGSGVRFTETGCEFDYLSTDKHQHGQVPTSAEDASSWCLSRPDEADTFCRTVQGHGRIDEHGNFWYSERIDNRLRRLGTADEKLALFQAPSNEFNDWHGHPRGHRGRNDYPCASVLRELKEAGLLTNVEYGRMRRGDIP